MFAHENDNINKIETLTNFEKIGRVKMSDYVFIPYYKIQFQGKWLKPGDYAKLKEYINIYFEQINKVGVTGVKKHDFKYIKYDPIQCNSDYLQRIMGSRF